MKTIDRFLKYIEIDTQSDSDSASSPSTKKQFDLANILAKELKELGLNPTLDEHCYVYAFLKSNTSTKIDKIGFIAHMDTAPDASGKGVNKRIIHNYDGTTIQLNDILSMSPKNFNCLNTVIGDDLIVTDGTTLLGADNKAGVAEIIGLIEYIQSNKDFKHGDIYICFTPDEEIGRGTDHFNFDLFKADYAYTVDGGDVNVISYETFNAASASIKFIGKSIHPGSAKDKLVNAINLAVEFHNLLPVHQRPEHTDGYDGFNHITSIKGEVENASSNYIIRNHSKIIFENQKEIFKTIATYINKKYGYNAVDLTIKDSYYNMKEILKDKMEIVDIASKAIANVGLTPGFEAVRGGTDGARLTFDGIPCPNLGTGGFNFHGPFEFLSVNQMNKAVEVLIEIVKIVSNKG